jgi:hypothetical protein
MRAPALLARGGRVVSVAAEPPSEGTYFVVEPNRAQLIKLTKLVDSGQLRVPNTPRNCGHSRLIVVSIFLSM